MGLHIPYEKWFANLDTIGNVGAGSVYLMVDELFQSGKLKKGEKILLLVPESSRFSYMYGIADGLLVLKMAMHAEINHILSLHLQILPFPISNQVSMKKEEIPQDPSALDKFTKEVCYAVDDQENILLN